jgi:site-specific DNA recombinase
MFSEAWSIRLDQGHLAKKTLSAQVKDMDTQMEVLLDRVVNAKSDSLVKAYEAKIERLETKKLLVADPCFRRGR